MNFWMVKLVWFRYTPSVGRTTFRKELDERICWILLNFTNVSMMTSSNQFSISHFSQSSDNIHKFFERIIELRQGWRHQLTSQFYRESSHKYIWAFAWTQKAFNKESEIPFHNNIDTTLIKNNCEREKVLFSTFS